MEKWCNQDVGMLILRIGVGFIFIAHGWAKLMSLGATTGFFENVGIPMAGFFALVVALVEFLGGLAVLFGVFTWLSGLLLAFVMLVAILKVKGFDAFTGPQGFELDFMLLCASLAVAKIKPGKYSVAKKFGKDIASNM